MKFPKLLSGALLGGTMLAGGATIGHVGVSPPDEPQGISIRQESERHRNRGFFYGYYSRSHRGGGLRGGK